MSRNITTLGAGLAAIVIVASASAGCAARGTERVLSDDDRTSARGGGIIRLREQPPFPVDARRRPVATLDDGEDAARSASSQTDGKPFKLQERRP